MLLRSQTQHHFIFCQILIPNWLTDRHLARRRVPSRDADVSFDVSGYPVDPYAERGMDEHYQHQCHQQYAPPPPQPMYPPPYGQPPPPPMYQQPYGQPYGQPVYASPYGQPPPPAMYPPPYAQPPPPPPPPRKSGASFAEGWYVPERCSCACDAKMEIEIWNNSQRNSRAVARLARRPRTVAN